MNNRTAGDDRITALYERLSRDDELAGDSSIANQKKMLRTMRKITDTPTRCILRTTDFLAGILTDRDGSRC